jgi:signal transduction histidine kinase
MFKQIFDDLINTVKDYYKYSLVILATTGILIPTYLQHERVEHMQQMQEQLSHLYKHIEEGINPIKTEVLICEVIGCFGYDDGTQKWVSDFGVDMQATNWSKAKYHEFKPTKDFYSLWYKKPFVYDIVVTKPDEKKLYYKKNFYPMFVKDMKIYILIQIVILIITLYLFSLLSKRERTLYKTVSEKESSLLNNIMTVYITENLHHELLTPVKVVMTKNRILGGIIMKEDDKLQKNGYGMSADNIEKSKESIDYIEMSVDQITSVLENMRQAKMVKKSSDQTIHDIIEHSVKLIDIITSDEFDYSIDDDLDNYKLFGELTTGSFVNIMLNHIKNSIEADADSIVVEIDTIEKKFLTFTLIDNGNGIPKEVLKRLFEPNNSSKGQRDKENSIRGNGLFLNKSIIERSGGSIELVDTSEMGTTFRIKIPIKKVINKEKPKED